MITPSPIQKATGLIRRAEKSNTHVEVDLETPSSWPLMAQSRAETESVTVARAGSGLRFVFPVDRQHIDRVTEAFQGMTSPTHLRKEKRPLMVRLTTPYVSDEDPEGTVPAGAIMLVSGIHRFAAAFAVGRWKSVYCNLIDATAEEASLIQAASNRDPILPARSREDIRRALELMHHNGEAWPSIKDGVALFKVSQRTYKRARQEARSSLGLLDGDCGDRPARPDWVAMRLPKSALPQFRATLRDVARDAGNEDVGVLLHRITSALLQVNDIFREQLEAAFIAASEAQAFPLDEDGELSDF